MVVHMSIFFLWAADRTPDEQLNQYAYVWCERAILFRELGETELAQANEGTCQAWENE